MIDFVCASPPDLWTPFLRALLPRRNLRHFTMMPASSLDPYTRLLASLADAVTKARQNMHSFTLFLIAAAILCVAGTLLAVTSIIWGPVLFILFWVWTLTAFFRLLVSFGGKTGMWINFLINQQKLKRSMRPMEDRSRYLRTQAAITDHSFLRTIFDTLPGVDANMAAERCGQLIVFFFLGSEFESFLSIDPHAQSN